MRLQFEMIENFKTIVETLMDAAAMVGVHLRTKILAGIVLSSLANVTVEPCTSISKFSDFHQVPGK